MAAKDHRSSFGLAALPVTVFAHLLFVAVTTLVLVWLLHIREGLAFKSEIKNKIFNVHPPLMVIGLILIPGEAIIAYKTIPGARKTQKLIHLMLLFVGLVAGIVGIYVVFKFLDEVNVPNLFTLHSWLGISTICLFALQWLLGFLYFYFPGASMYRRARVAPWHVFFGIVIFFMAILSAETGLAERFTFLRLQHGQEALIMNFVGVLILIFGISVGLSVFLPQGGHKAGQVGTVANSNV